MPREVIHRGASDSWAILAGMTQKKYTFFTIFFIAALLILTSVAWRDYVTSQSAAGLGVF